MAKQKLFDGQHDDEDVLLVFRRHPVVMRKGLIAVLLLTLLGMLPYTFWPDTSSLVWFIPLGLLLGALVMFYYWVGWYFSLFIVSDQRFIQISQRGLFHRSVVDVGLDKIQNINYQVSGVQQTVLGFGTILIQTFVGDLVLENIHHPADMQQKIIAVVKEAGFDTSQIYQQEEKLEKASD